MKIGKFEAKRVSKTRDIVLNGRIEDVYPLFGAIEEKKWARGWDLELIYSETKLIEKNMIFTTKGKDEGENEYLWNVTQYKPEEYIIEYTVSTGNRVWSILVICSEIDENNTKATISYTYTGLNSKGNELNESHIKRMYAEDLKDWERAINYYLETGGILIEG